MCDEAGDDGGSDEWLRSWKYRKDGLSSWNIPGSVERRIDQHPNSSEASTNLEN